MKILIINSSHRVGNTDLICEKLKSNFSDHQVRELKLREVEMKMPDGCEECAESRICPNISDQFSSEIEPTIRDYDLYIIATPTWSDNTTPLLNIFWNRIVSWNAPERKYLKGKKLALITHGMADESSWINIENWVKSVCTWEESIYAGSLFFKSGSRVGDLENDKEKISNFINTLEL